MYRWILAVICLLPLLVNAETVLSEQPARALSGTTVPVLSISGAIGPAVSDYLIREIEQINEARSAPMIILTIDTPGGLSSSLRDINQQILNSEIPLACLVYPQGARAASAGTYILYACHIAAMAPTTTLGAATPVQIGGGILGGEEEEQKSNDPSAMEKKVLNDSIAYIRSLAQLRGRNVEWAELAVREGATLTAQEALEQNVIDVLAESPEQLLTILDGRDIKMGDLTLRLVLGDAALEYRNPDWRSRFISTITDPNIAYILMLVGIYGLLLEFYSPGIGVAGVTGAIALFIALYAFQLLPLNYVGLGLLLLGVALLIVESIVPSFGIFGLGGIIAFVMGSIFLFDSRQSDLTVSYILIFGVALVSALFILFVLGGLWRFRRKAIVSGQESLVGATATVLDEFQGSGYVLVGGERWRAHSEQALKQEQAVEVERVEGLVLHVAAKHNHGGDKNGHDL